METRNSRSASTVSSGSHSLHMVNAFSPANTSIHEILALAAIGLGHRGVEDAHRGAPDVGAGAVAFDERDDRLVGDLQLPVLVLNAIPLPGDLRVFIRRHWGAYRKR